MLRARLLSAALPVALLTTAPLLSACVGDRPTVALLLADASGASGQVVDADLLTERVEATCDECRVTVQDAEGDAEVQKSQARQAAAGSADVVVVEPVDADDLATLAGDDLPVVSVGELVAGSEAFVGLTDGAAPARAASDLDAARDVLLGREDSMAFVPVRTMSEQAADVAVGLLAGEPVEAPEVVDGVDTWLHESQDVTVDTLTTVLVGQGVLTLDELCDGDAAKRCVRLGLR